MAEAGNLVRRARFQTWRTLLGRSRIRLARIDETPLPLLRAMRYYAGR
jgi:hypothetical protein